MVEFHPHKRSDIVDLGQTLAILPWVPGRWYEGQYKGVNWTTAAPTLGTVHYDLVHVPTPTTITALAARITSAVTSNVTHLALYNSSAGGAAPTTKIAGGSVAAAAVGLAQVTGLGMTLQPGFYWTAFLNIGGATSPQTAMAQGGAAVAVRGDISPIAQNTVGPLPPSYMQVSQTSLPATATPVLATDTQTARPRVALLAS